MPIMASRTPLVGVGLLVHQGHAEDVAVVGDRLFEVADRHADVVDRSEQPGQTRPTRLPCAGPRLRPGPDCTMTSKDPLSVESRSAHMVAGNRAGRRRGVAMFHGSGSQQSRQSDCGMGR